MANSLNRTLIACSIIPVFILATLYYWRVKKRNVETAEKKPSASAAVKPETIERVSKEVIPSEKLDKNHQPDTKASAEIKVLGVEAAEVLMQPNEKTRSKSLGGENFEGEPLVDFTPPGGGDNVSLNGIHLKNINSMSFDLDKAQNDPSRSDNKKGDVEPDRIVVEEDMLSKKVAALDLKPAPVDVGDSTDGNRGSIKTPPPVPQDNNDKKNLNCKEDNEVIIENIGDDLIPVGSSDSSGITTTNAAGAPEMADACNSTTNTTSPLTVESRYLSKEKIMPSASEKRKVKTTMVDSEPVQQRLRPTKTFAQVLSKNCDSITKNHLSSKKQDVNGLPMSAGANENEVDIYQNFPDLSTATPPPSSEQAMSLALELADTRSQGSNDSGKGSCTMLMQEDNGERVVANGENFSSDVSPASTGSLPPIMSPILHGPDDEYICYNFEIPMDFCGMLIGKKGRFINPLKGKTRTQITIYEYSPTSNICSIVGPRSNVINALNQIRARFSPEHFPEINLNHVELTPTIPLTHACQLHLPPVVWTEVILSCTINAGHFFLQQPTHPTYPRLSHLDREMRQNYSKMDAPLVPQVHPGLICAFSTNEGWFRASVKHVHFASHECDLVFVDYGGYVRNVPVSSLRQIHRNFMSLPFQASECYLARVQPADIEVGWTPEANKYFEQLANGHIIYAQIDGIAEDGIPCVNLFSNSNHGEPNTNISIQEELVKAGHASWL